MIDNFAVFIITHGRPDDQLTYNALRVCGYTGKIYFVIDDTDITIQQYIDNYSQDNILVFDKNHYINDSKYDNGTTEGLYNCAVYARRAVEDMAIALRLSYFVLADDDITRFVIRYNVAGTIKRIKLNNMDMVFDICLDFMSSGNIGCIGFGNQPMYLAKPQLLKIPGYLQLKVDGLIDLPLNLFVRKTSFPVNWACWYGEDDIAAIMNNKLGSIWFNVPYIMREISNLGTGAMQDIYALKSSYIRTFAKYRYNPADFYIRINNKGQMNGQYSLRKTNVSMFPKIISGRYKRKEK